MAPMVAVPRPPMKVVGEVDLARVRRPPQLALAVGVARVRVGVGAAERQISRVSLTRAATSTPSRVLSPGRLTDVNVPGRGPGAVPLILLVRLALK